MVELYQSGEPVEISFGDEGWLSGQVVGLQHPGVWVVTEKGLWFVTNGRRIRKSARAADNST